MSNIVNKFSDICLDVDNALNDDLENREFGFLLVVCQVDGTLIGGKTVLMSNMDDTAAVDVLHEASAHMKAEDEASGPQHKGKLS